MNIQSAEPTVTVTVEELERNPEGVLDQAAQTVVAICTQGEPVAVLVSFEVWNTYVRQLQMHGIDLQDGRRVVKRTLPH
ncbi:hypothetical protein BWP39_21910 [Paraburkholderia acidicola]|uniref:Type II toxin-antitoxin system Phd/YefM family antitoxin n=1 Tax=Paraburkholderia acidicola TaxID=1912599 RepID=A0A2A4ENE5_9BURK|nr:type II toxin-antitoxin system prevent-host-death family antitoxin [Paraburkholderia acidicola]PCE22335.1 hypothetical protein BWP39_21910 [Paraburkholderia acidicola]